VKLAEQWGGPMKRTEIVEMRPNGDRCWICNERGQATDSQSPYFACKACGVMWYGGAAPNLGERTEWPDPAVCPPL
jgi:hypothetical protein